MLRSRDLRGRISWIAHFWLHIFSPTSELNEDQIVQSLCCHTCQVFLCGLHNLSLLSLSRCFILFNVLDAFVSAALKHQVNTKCPAAVLVSYLFTSLLIVSL